MKSIITKDVDSCAKALKSGEVVAFPTETVYGLGAVIDNEKAVENIFKIKGRPKDNPLIVHVNSIEMAKSLCTGWNEEAYALANAFWPGPLTLVLPKAKEVGYFVTGGLDFVGIRMPKSDLALELISKCETALCAPSANTSTRPSPTKAEHVYNDLGDKLSYILDGGTTDVGIESTVYDVLNKKILRPGSITLSDIKGFIDKADILASEGEKIASPGVKYKHYAPCYEVVAVVGETPINKMRELKEEYIAKGKTCELVTFGEKTKDALYIGKDIDEYCKNFYSTLLDLEGKSDVVIFMGTKPEEKGLALMNRLKKACGGNIIYT